MLKIRRTQGFSLIELMIGLAVLSMLLLLGVPAFSTVLQNMKLRSSAENFVAGMQLARAEAVRRNTQVEILLTDDDANGVNAVTTAYSPTGRTWIVRAVSGGVLKALDYKLGYEGEGSMSTPAVKMSGSTDAGATPVSSVVFDGFGIGYNGSNGVKATLTAPIVFQFTNPVGGACAPAGPMRCLNVTVSMSGGKVRMCDPAVNTVTSPGDSRAC